MYCASCGSYACVKERQDAIARPNEDAVENHEPPNEKGKSPDLSRPTGKDLGAYNSGRLRAQHLLEAQELGHKREKNPSSGKVGSLWKNQGGGYEEGAALQLGGNTEAVSDHRTG